MKLNKLNSTSSFFRFPTKGLVSVEPKEFLRSFLLSVLEELPLLLTSLPSLPPLLILRPLFSSLSSLILLSFLSRVNLSPKRRTYSSSPSTSTSTDSGRIPTEVKRLEARDTAHEFEVGGVKGVVCLRWVVGLSLEGESKVLLEARRV